MTRFKILITLAFIVFLSISCAGTELAVNPTPTTQSGPAPTNLILAASNSSSDAKARANIICDGINDSKIIASSIRALPAGGTVALLAGTYHLNQRLLVSGIDNITLVGEGPATILKENDAISTKLSSSVTAGANIISVADAKGLVPGQDVFIGSTDGAKQTQDTARAPYWEAQRMVGPGGESNIITAVNGNLVTVYYNLTNSYEGNENVWTMFDATYFTNCNNLKVMNLTLDGNRSRQITTTGDIFLNGLRFSTCNDLEVTGVYVKDVYYNHLMLHPGACLRANIHDNIVTTTSVAGDTQTRGIVIESSSDGTYVKNNRIAGQETGIYDVGSKIFIQNNYCQDNTEYGIFNNRGSDTIISGNKISSAGSAGIALLDRQAVTEAGFKLNNNVFNNTIDSTRGRNAIDNVGGSYVSITNNVIKGSAQKGIRVMGGTYNIVTGNEIIDAGQQSNASYPGIEVVSAPAGLISPEALPSRFNQINNNTISKSLSNDLNYCIYLDDKSIDNTVIDNKLSGFAFSAINQTGMGNTIEGHPVTKIAN